MTDAVVVCQFFSSVTVWLSTKHDGFGKRLCLSAIIIYTVSCNISLYCDTKEVIYRYTQNVYRPISNTYIHIYTYIHTYIYTKRHRHTYIHTHIDTQTHTQRHTYTDIQTHTHTHRHTDTYAYRHIYIHRHKDTHMHTYKDTCTHTYIYVCVCLRVCLCVCACACVHVRDHLNNSYLLKLNQCFGCYLSHLVRVFNG